MLALVAPGVAPGVAAAARGGEGVSRKEAQAVRTTTPPRIDGVLDDAAWALAPEETSFKQNSPREGEPPTQATRFRVLYDDRAIYVGVRCDDTEPERIRAPLARRDTLNESDTVWLQLDSQHDHTSGFAFALTASGVQIDARMYDDVEFGLDWDTVWEGEVSRDDDGWSAEFEIPLRALRFDAEGEQHWGLNVLRYLPRTQEDASWTFWPATSMDARVSRFGHLGGLRRLRPRRTLELRPFVVTRLGGESPDGGLLGARGETETRVDAGLDLKLGLTSDLTFDATVNPDFGQVDADPAVLNLSRFEVYFPERRPFFLEGFDLFQTPVQLFYTRRIGQGSGVGDGETLGGKVLDGSPAVPRILAAAKVSGKATSRLSLGVLGAVTGAEEGAELLADGTHAPVRLAPPRAFGIARGRYALGGGGSFVGVATTGVATLGDDVGRALDGHDGYVQALDLVLRSPTGRLTLTAQGVVSERVGGAAIATRDGATCPGPASGCVPLARADGTPGAPGQVGAGGVTTLTVQGKHLVAEVAQQSFSPTLDLNDAGFVQEWNRHFVRGTIGLRETQGKGRLQNYGVRSYHIGGLRWDGLPLFAFSGLNPWITTRGFFHLWGDVGYRYIRGWDLFDARDGARAERVRDVFTQVGFATNQARAISLSGRVSRKQRVDEASGYGGELNVTVRTGGALELQLGGELSFEPSFPRFYSCADDAGEACTIASTDRTYVWGDLHSAYGSVTARASYTFSTRLSLQTYAQLFTARGDWSGYRGARVSGTRPVLRPRTFAPVAYDNDADGDGIADDAFAESTLNLNVVLRWEPVRGTALLGVYTRAQAATHLEPGRPSLGFEGLGRGQAVDVVLLKLVLFIS